MQLQRTERDTVEEEAVADDSNGSGDVDGHQLGAPHEGARLNHLDRFGQLDKVDVLTLLEGTTSDALNRIADSSVDHLCGNFDVLAAVGF